MSTPSFKPGDTVIFDPSTDPMWDLYSQTDKVRWYGDFGYEFLDIGREEPVYGFNVRKRLLTFICEHNPQHGHCVLMQMWSGKLILMCHMDNFRLATEDEV